MFNNFFTRLGQQKLIKKKATNTRYDNKNDMKSSIVSFNNTLLEMFILKRHIALANPIFAVIYSIIYHCRDRV